MTTVAAIGRDRVNRCVHAAGGSRPWFLCLGCGRRQAMLCSVGGRFRCRACHDLAYSSTRETPADRTLRRADKLRRKLGARPGPHQFAAKPKRMH